MVTSSGYADNFAITMPTRAAFLVLVFLELLRTLSRQRAFR